MKIKNLMMALIVTCLYSTATWAQNVAKVGDAEFETVAAAISAATTEQAVETIEISTVEELKAFRDAVNGGKQYKDTKVVLTADLDLSSEANWTPIGNLVAYPGQSFDGVFDGNGHTISHLTVIDNTPKYAVAALFGSVVNGTIKNLTVKDVNIQSSHYAAGIVAYTSNKPTIENCHVIGGTIISTPELVGNEFDNGDKVGGIMGYCTAGTTITNCSVEGVNITGYRDLGGICGYAGGTVTDCTVKNVTITQDDTNVYKSGDLLATTVGKVVCLRSADAAATNEAYTTENVELKHVGVVSKIGNNSYTTFEAAFAALQDGETITLLADCAGNGIVAPEGKFANGVTVDFGGHTYTINGATLAGSTGTKTQAFQLLKGNTITFKNGTIVGDNADVKMLIQNYSNLTLEGMTLDATQGNNSIGYVLSTNNGATTIKDTKITAKSTGTAFDACSGWGGYASNAVEVTGTSEINGNVEVSYYGQEGTNPASLTLASGTLNGSIVMAKGADECNVTKADAFDAVAPEGYKWVEGENGMQTLAACEYVAQVGDQKYETLQAAFDAAEAEDTENIVIDLLADATIDITARANVLSIGTENTKSITINGNDHALTFNQKNSDWNDVSTANDAVTKLTLKDMAITSSGYNNGPWNRHDINFSCAVELNNVTSDKALAFKNSATLRNVTVNDNSGDIYAIWISPRVEGQTIDIDGLSVTCSRGIKVDDQYVSNEGEVQDITLNIANATFETTKKSAILVKSAAKTTITASNLDITNAKADNVNAVWVDEANAKRYGDVTLNGEGVTMIPEGGEAAYQASLIAGDKIEGYYKVFTEAVAAATDENVITLHADIADAYTLDSGKTLKINKNGKTINVVAPEGCLLNETTEGDVTTFTATLLSDSDIVLVDGEAYTYTADTEVKSAAFVRKFPESVVNIYLSWFVPFDYTITAEDANKFEFYKINMIANAPNPGVSEESDKVWIYINKMEVGDVLRGNMPYLFKPLEAAADGYEFKADNAVLKAKNEGVLISTETMLNKYSFYGTYNKVTLSPNDAELGLYMGNKGSLSFPETQSINVGAYRWIIRVSSKSGIAYVREFHFVDGSESTGVRNVASESETESFYTLDGVKVEAPAKGIYVMKRNDGTTKKVLFK